MTRFKRHTIRSMRLAALFIAVPLTLAVGCRQMVEQPSYRPLEASTDETDPGSALLPPKGTVSQGGLKNDIRVDYGRENPSNLDVTLKTLFGPDEERPIEPTAEEIASIPYVATIPIQVDEAVLARGEQRFGIYCAICHGASGQGDGKLVEHTFPQPPTLLSDRLRTMPDGYLFGVATDGLGWMPSYRSQVPIDDRWAIIAHVRTLQRDAAAGK